MQNGSGKTIGDTYMSCLRDEMVTYNAPPKMKKIRDNRLFVVNWIFSAPPCVIGDHMRNIMLAPARRIAGKPGHLVFGPQLSRQVRTSCMFSLYNLTPPTIHSVQGLSSCALAGSQIQGIPLMVAVGKRRDTCSCIPAGHRSVLPR